MQINQLSPKHKPQDKKRVGRGGRKGTYSGKGMKGQKSRAGRKMVPLIRELIKRYPKLRGYRRFVIENYVAVVNIADLDKHCKDGETVNPENLIQKGLIAMVKGKTPKVKILGKGAITKKLVVERCNVSITAKASIEKAGGSIAVMQVAVAKPVKKAKPAVVAKTKSK